MLRLPSLWKLLLTFWLALLGGLGFAAEITPEQPAINPQPEQENPPVVAQPPLKRHKRRPAPARHSHETPARVEFGEDVEIAAGETVPGLVVIGGNATVDGSVDGCLVVISGSAKVNGQVAQDLVTILGSATLGPEAHVSGNAVVVGGPLKVNPKAAIDGERTTVALGHIVPNFLWLQNWVTKGLFLARPFPPRLKWVWVVGALFLGVYLAMALLFPRPIHACVERLENQPVAAFFMGILLLVLLGPLVTLLAVSVVGLPVLPFVFCALVAAALFGKIAVYSYTGLQVGRQLHVPNLSLPLVLLVGVVLFYAIYMVPVLGFAVWGMATLLGFGAVLLATFGAFRHEQPTVAPAVPAMAAVASAVPPGMGASAGPISAPPLPPPVLSASEAVLLPRVGFWRRLAATILDFLLLVMLIHLVGPLFPLLWAGYHVGMWTWKGTTVGGIVMSIKIVRTDGKPMDFAVAFVRCLSSFFSAFALFLGFFWAGWDKERQSWHDKIAGTVVVKVPKGMSLI
jgi:uncharacterized RDD family membrane protein YckC